MKIIETRAYQKAFIQYLRRGTSISLSLKAAAEGRTTPQYIWRNRGDNKVRYSHAVNNGKVFSWDNPPPTGNPSEGFNCRCTAESYVRGQSEFANQTVISGIDSRKKWELKDAVLHFYFGGGRLVTLTEIGHLTSVIDYYLYRIVRGGKNSYERINAQIIEAARLSASGTFSYSFDASYDEFGDYEWWFGGGAVAGMFNGTVRHENGMMYIYGDISFRYSDTFTDPATLRQILGVTSEPLDAEFAEIFVTDAAGTFFDIVGTWESSFRAEAKLDRKVSRYQFNE